MWVLCIFSKLSSAHFYSLLHHYQSFGYIVLFRIFADDSNNSYFISINSSLGNFIIMLMIPFTQLIFPPSSFIVMWYSHQTKIELDNDPFLVAFIFTIILSALFLIHDLFHARSFIKHNNIIFAMVFIITPSKLSIILILIFCLVIIILVFDGIRYFSKIVVFGNEETIRDNYSGFKHLKVTIKTLMYDLLLSVKVLFILLSYYLQLPILILI